MVSYCGQSSGMFRHPPANGHFQTNAPIQPWYASGYPQTTQLGAANPYCVQEEQQQMWHHHQMHPHSVFPHAEYADYMHAGIGGIPSMQHPQHQLDPDNQLPSPPTTVSGSDMSSPGAPNDNISPHGHISVRPPPARSPYEWMTKTSHQAQPNPGKTRTKDKYRVVYTDHQRLELEKEFTFNNKYITIRRKSELAANLGLSERQIKIWFQNRRAKERKQNKKRVEEKTTIDIGGYQNLQHMDMISPNVPPQSVVLQRFIDTHGMKHENGEIS